MTDNENSSGHKIKSKKLEFSAILIALILVIIYFQPQIVMNLELKKEDAIIEICKTITEKTLEKARAAKSKKVKIIDLDKITQEAAQELKTQTGGEQVCGSEKCSYCCQLQYDKTTNTVIVTGYDKMKDVITRTVVTPESYVVWTRQGKEDIERKQTKFQSLLRRHR